MALEVRSVGPGEHVILKQTGQHWPWGLARSCRRDIKRRVENEGAASACATLMARPWSLPRNSHRGLDQVRTRQLVRRADSVQAFAHSLDLT